MINDISKLKVFLLKTNKKSFLNKSITKEKAFKTLIFPTFTTDLILN